MHYEINVARDGSHYFATDKRSLITADATTKMVLDFTKRFPVDEGFTISVSYHPGISYCTPDINEYALLDVRQAILSLSDDN